MTVRDWFNKLPDNHQEYGNFRERVISCVPFYVIDKECASPMNAIRMGISWWDYKKDWLKWIEIFGECYPEHKLTPIHREVQSYPPADLVAKCKTDEEFEKLKEKYRETIGYGSGPSSSYG